VPTILIAYDLRGAGKDYAALHESIKAIGTAWWHHLDSTWIVKTDKTPSSIRDTLKESLDDDDELLVIDVSSRSRAWTGFNERGSRWLKGTYL
jgi:hypothetical protein